MTRGNQRDIDRARAQARAQKSGSGAGKKPEDDVRHTSKMEANAEIMRAKQKAAEEKRIADAAEKK